MARADQQLRAARLAARVIELKTTRRMTFQQIGDECGFSKQRAFTVWTEALRKLPAPNLEQHRTDAIQFTDQMVTELLTLARRPNESARTIAELHRQINGWEEHKARLLGSYQPQRREVQVISGDTIDRSIAELTARMNIDIEMARTSGMNVDDLLKEIR
jgi:hypothetical protein